MKNLIICLSIGLFLAGCSTTSVNKAEVARVKKVAVIAYTMDYNMNLKEGMMSALMGGERKMGMSKIENKLEEKPISKRSYQVIVKQLNKMGWRTLGYDATKQSPTLASYYQKRVKTGFLPLQDRHIRLEKRGIPQYHNAYSLKGTGKFARIAKELGVDALAFVYVDTGYGNSFSLGPIGLGSYSYNSKVKLDLINPRSEEKILSMVVDGESQKEKQRAEWLKNDLHQDNSFRGVKVAVKQLMEKIESNIK